MRASDIKVRKIYNVIFDPVRDCEFNGKHLAVVLKKNNDKATFIVMPLTSASNGVGINKIHIGKITSLPSSLRDNSTYAVFNQIRTIHASRFIALKEVIGGVNTPIDCPVDDGVFQTVLQYAISELVFIFSPDEKMDIFNLLFQKAKLDKCIELAYNIKRANAKIEELSNDKGLLEKELGLLLADFEYVLDKKEIDNGIQDIFEKSLLTNKD